MRVRAVCVVFTLWLLGVPAVAGAQPGATGPVADLNAKAREFHETDPARSLGYAEQALSAAQASKDPRGEAEARNYVAYAYRQQSRLDDAQREAQESVRLFIRVGDPTGEAQGYNTLGLIAADDGRFAEALECHLKALAIRERTGDREGLAYTYNNLGNTYRNMGDYTRALEHHELGLRLKVELGFRESEAFSHHNIGLVYFAMKDYPKAREAYQRGMAIREALRDTRGIAASLNAIGTVEAVDAPAAALVTFERALGLRREANDERGEMATQINIADVLRRLERHAEAITRYTQALAIGGRIDAPLMTSNALKGLAESEAARGEWKAAYEHQVAYHAAHDKIFNAESMQKFQRLQRDREIRHLEAEGKLREAELARARTSRTALALIAGLVVISLVLLYARYRLKHRSEAALRQQADKLTEALDRVQTLKGLLPICASCKKIRDDNGYWTQVEAYVAAHTAAEFTHSICPTCFDTLYPDMRHDHGTTGGTA
jgi:tetratricopeptide (TPR) repeat protein